MSGNSRGRVVSAFGHREGKEKTHRLEWIVDIDNGHFMSNACERYRSGEAGYGASNNDEVDGKDAL